MKPIMTEVSDRRRNRHNSSVTFVDGGTQKKLGFGKFFFSFLQLISQIILVFVLYPGLLFFHILHIYEERLRNHARIYGYEFQKIILLID